MTINRNKDYLLGILRELRNLPSETEWVEFKHNKARPEDIGEYISTLANSTALLNKISAWIVWGIDNKSHEIIGTTFQPKQNKIGNEELESWLLRLLKPKIDFCFYELEVDEKQLVMLEISAAFRHPVQFKNIEYIRIGSYKKKLKDYPEKERALWRVFDRIPFEQEIAAENLTPENVLQCLDYPAYFDLFSLPLPENRDGILSALKSETMISKNDAGQWNITNLGAILFAKKLSDFRHLQRKAVRVILYSGKNRVETIREQVCMPGYAPGFIAMINFITDLLPKNELIDKALRKNVPLFPELAIRELIANAIIHQDFHTTGTSPMVEIFSNRMEIINPGLPLVDTERFLDSPPISRNEALAAFMRRIGICEERGSGIDKVVQQTEFYQLPAPIFEVVGGYTRAILFTHKELRQMDKADRIRACYLHACLRYVQRDYMTNSTLRSRFGIAEKNSATASRIIKEATESNMICPFDDSASKKYMRYVPRWA